jgi:hypothetical protein
VTTITINSSALRSPSSMVPCRALNVFPHALHLYLARVFPWLTRLPAPIFPLAGQFTFGQNVWQAAFGRSVLFIHHRLLIDALVQNSAGPSATR